MRHKQDQDCSISLLLLTAVVRLLALLTIGAVCTADERPAPPSKEELERRLARPPVAVAKELAAVYGQELREISYIPAFAVIGRIRLADFIQDKELRQGAFHRVDEWALFSRDLNPKSGSEQAGHLVFAEVARRTKLDNREPYIKQVLVAANQMFDEAGQPRALMPFHNEMSDAVFMGGPILAAAGKLTGEAKYFDACARHIENMQKLCLRADGLYRHSPLCEAAWGRGNGFPALGLALVLDDFPQDHPAREKLLQSLQSHLTALLKYQHETGCWQQVIDEPSSYLEFSCTCMIGFAIEHGIVRGWLDENAFRPAVDRAWQAAKARIGPGGTLEAVCIGTGKQKTLEDYLTRPASFGVDARGGAMALLFATEKAR